MKKIPKFPRGEGPGVSEAPLATSFWFPPDSVEKQAENGSGFTYRPGKIWLGRTATDKAVPVGWMDDRHMVTVAGSRTGKGVSAIIPALCEYPGSVICIDPKGENAMRTAARRGFGTSKIQGLGQDVYVLDPYRVSGVPEEYLATFDPLSGLSADSETTMDEATLIADALVVSTGGKDAHWDDSARALIEAIILHVISDPAFEGRRTLGTVRQLIRDGDVAELEAFYAKHEADAAENPATQEVLDGYTALSVLLYKMGDNPAFDGLVAGIGAGLMDLSEEERGSVLSTARRNTKFLDAPRMQACLRESSHAVKLEDLKRDAHGVTVYVVLPSRFMSTHSRWMRLILNLTISRLEADAAKPNHPVLAILDEFPTLGHMPVLETAVGYMAGFGLKIWAVLQDLSQLKRHYRESWETFLGNAGLIQFFGNSDQTTLNYISQRLGDLEVIREGTSFSESETITITDISDFDKLQRVERKGRPGMFSGFALASDTKSSSKAAATSENTDRKLEKTALLTPDEIRRIFSRASGLQIIALADYRPLFLRRVRYFEDEHFAGKYQAD